MINIKNLSFSYNQSKPILKDVSFSINDGECVILLGPNGVGKSTLIKCILGVLNYKEGLITYNDTDLKKMSSSERGKLLSFVPQLIDGNNLTVKDTIIAGRLPHFMIYPTKTDFEFVDDVIKKMGLEEIIDKQTNEISGGERQKCAIARAIAQDATTIIFDEPTSNLDINAQLSIVRIIKNYLKDKTRSSLISMHDINLALELGDKFVFLKDEKIYKVCQKKDVTEDIIKDVYGVNIKIINHNGKKVVVYEEND